MTTLAIIAVIIIGAPLVVLAWIKIGDWLVWSRDKNQ